MVAGRVLGGRYRPEQLAGSGGMGAVWRGRDLRLDRPVAIKMLAGEGLSDPTALERFEREARTVARLTHPNIVAVYDFSIDGGDPYLVMELVEGWSVAAMLADGPLTLSQAVAIAAQTCDGLSAAHAAAVIHRDVKPANLILTPGGLVKICDFGIARLQHAAGQPSLTGAAVAMGSSSYMAPEQANRQAVDPRTDLYGLGCTLYAMLTGKPPFAGDAFSVVQQHLTQPPAPLQTRRSDVPPGLAELVDELLAKAPADRPRDAVQVKTRLSTLFADMTATTGPTADLRLAAVPEAAPVADVSISGVVTPLALSSASRPVPAIPNNRSPERSAQTWRLAAFGLAVLLAVIAIPWLGAAGCLPTTASVPPRMAAGAAASSSPARAASPPAQPTASAPPSTASETRTPAPPSAFPATNSPLPAADPIVGMRLSIQHQVATGHLNPNAAPDLYKKVDEIAARINEGNAAEAAKRIKELRDKLTNLRDGGKLTGSGYEALIRDLDRIEASLS